MNNYWIIINLLYIRMNLKQEITCGLFCTKIHQNLVARPHTTNEICLKMKKKNMLGTNCSRATDNTRMLTLALTQQSFPNNTWTEEELRKWFEPSNIPWLKMSIWVTGVLRRTVVGYGPFDNLCWRHHQSLLSRWLLHRLLKRQLPTTVLLRTPVTQMIISVKTKTYFDGENSYRHQHNSHHQSLHVHFVHSFTKRKASLIYNKQFFWDWYLIERYYY